MHVRRTLALTLAVPLLLAGCSDKAEPTPKMPDPTTSSATPAESETPEAESAEDFIRRWADIEAEMENTGDTAEYRELAPACGACQDLADLVEKYYAAGGYVKWDGWDIKSIEPRGESSKVFLVAVDSAPTTYVTERGAKEKSFAGGPGRHLLTLKPAHSTWVVVDKSEVER